jgi:uncharacterized protein YecA (UPF0149 family)
MYQHNQHTTVKLGRQKNCSKIIETESPDTNQLQNWQLTTLKNCSILHEDQLKNLIQDSSKPILITSDGGIHDYQGTFAVVLSEEDEPLLQNHGKLYSQTFYETSFRSVAYT